MATATDQILEMMVELEAIKVDAGKFENGNNSAGTRVRLGMQRIKEKAQLVRTTVSAKKAAA